jgi:outer membrane receptor protein involved in Fe transport
MAARKRRAAEANEWIIASCVFFLVLVSSSPIAQAEDAVRRATYSFNIPRQRADLALTLLAEQADLTLVFPFDEVRKRTAQRLVGEYDLEGALQILLSGTGLKATFSNQVVLNIAPDATAGPEGNEMNVKKKAGIGAFLAAVFSVGANAQDVVGNDDVDAESGDGAVEEILVTGSRIRRSDTTSVGPMTSLSEEDISNTGITNAEILLQRLPSSAGFAGNSNAAYWVSGGWGTAQVNLRGLGGNRTLVLLNGRRVVSGGSGANDSVDLNMIPLSVVSRVEVLKDGASAIYGADAVAGVVNFITKDSFEGLQLDTKLGQSRYGDGEELSIGLTWGISGDKGDLIFDARYQDNRAAPLVDRAPCALADINGDNTLVCSPGSSSTAGGRAVLPDGSQINFTGGDAFEPFDIQAHGFNSNPFFNASNPVERLSISTFGNYELSDRTRVFTEAMFNWRTSTQPGSPATLRNIAFDASHPTNPTGQDIVVLRRRTAEFGARIFEQEVNTWRLVAGIEGEFGNDWSYDVAFNWGRNNAIDALLNNINVQRLGETLDPAVCGAGGIPCADILGEGDLTADVGDYILFNQRDSGSNEQKSISANISGSIFELPAGTVGFAAGFEYREDSGELNPDALLTAGAALGNAQDPITGSIEATEVFGEVHLPVLSGVTGVEDLTVDLAVRFSDYDLFGSDTNYKTGINWQVSPAFKVRGTYSTAFRAPSIPELFSGVREAQLPTADPCSDWASLDPSSTIYQNCQAAGVPANYVQFGSVVVTDVGGNPGLKPEDAETFTIGAVLEPGNLPGLALTLDYFEIDIDNSIAQTGGSAKLNICYTSQGLSHPFCGPEHHSRNPLTGDIDFLSAQSANTGSEIMSGFDIGASYSFDIGSVSQQVKLKATHLQEYEIVAFDGDSPIVRDGGVGCCVGGYPEWRANGSWTAATEKWSGSYNMQMIGSATDWNGAPGAIGTDIDAVFYHNLQGSYRLNDTVELRFGVDNLLDEDAPYVRSWTDGNTDTMTYSLFGRFVYARAVLNLY